MPNSFGWGVALDGRRILAAFLPVLAGDEYYSNQVNSLSGKALNVKR